MVKMKAECLANGALSWAVMKAFGPNSFAAAVYYADDGKTPLCVDDQIDMPETWEPGKFWEQGGAIIDSEGISVIKQPLDAYNSPATQWFAAIGDTDDEETMGCRGPTALIAAMRAFVFARLGAEIEVPKELA